MSQWRHGLASSVCLFVCRDSGAGPDGESVLALNHLLSSLVEDACSPPLSHAVAYWYACVHTLATYARCPLCGCVGHGIDFEECKIVTPAGLPAIDWKRVVAQRARLVRFVSHALQENDTSSHLLNGL